MEISAWNSLQAEVMLTVFGAIVDGSMLDRHYAVENVVKRVLTPLDLMITAKEPGATA